jgi:hypothetical protein
MMDDEKDDNCDDDEHDEVDCYHDGDYDDIRTS